MLHNIKFMKKNANQDQSCQICYRIACRRCSWIASEEDVLQIQQGLLISCPVCGWKPDEGK
jgi:hypothetical protein